MWGQSELRLVCLCVCVVRQSPSSVLEHLSGSSDAGHVDAFFFWLYYCERVIATAHETLAGAICNSIQEVFLTASLLPKMVKV